MRWTLAPTPFGCRAVHKWSEVLPLGPSGTTSLLLAASQQFAAKGMDWRGYYHETAERKFPHGSVGDWNVFDHGVNNAEGALRFPSMQYSQGTILKVGELFVKSFGATLTLTSIVDGVLRPWRFNMAQLL